MKKPEHVVIAGAGLVGSLLAAMLTLRNYRVTVFEKRGDLRRQDMSAGRSINLALAERGIHALKIAGLMGDVEPLLIPMRGRLLHDRNGSLSFSPYGQRPNEVIYSVSRAELNKLMMDATDRDSRSVLLFQHEIESVDFDRQTINLMDTETDCQKTIEFDFLIGADGSGSQIRQDLIKATDGSDDSEFLDHDYKELTIEPGIDGQFLMEKEALHIWPRGGYMLIALPNLDCSYTVTLFLPRSSESTPSFDDLTTKQAVQDLFEQQFPDVVPMIPNLADEFFENPTGQLGTVRCWPWIYEDRAMILGDAAHAIVPFHGQGMNAGFEDCAEFCRLLDKHDEDWSSTIQEFQIIRKPNTDAIAEMALENYIIMRDSVTDEKFQLKKEIGFLLEKKFTDRFIPRYSLVMFHRVPYWETFERGQIQDQILNQLTEGIDSLESLDWSRAGQLIESQLTKLQLD